jgi:hypothetical protein
MRRQLAIGFAVAAAGLMGVAAPPAARANIVFSPGNHPQPGEQNVLLNKGTTGSTITGTSNQSHEVVVFKSSTQTLSAPDTGQARLEAVSSGKQVALSDVSSIALQTGNYRDLIFDSHIGGSVGTSGGTETITVTDNLGTTHTFTMTLGTGSNFLTITASGGESIASTAISYPRGFTDLEQIRISTAAFVPEPSSIVLAGTSVIGLLAVYGWRRRHP